MNAQKILELTETDEYSELKKAFPQFDDLSLNRAAWLLNLNIERRICLECLAKRRVFNDTVPKREIGRYVCRVCGAESDPVSFDDLFWNKAVTPGMKALFQSKLRKRELGFSELLVECSDGIFVIG